MTFSQLGNYPIPKIDTLFAEMYWELWHLGLNQLQEFCREPLRINLEDCSMPL